ncbi:MAG: ROK family protein [Devosiaceae bacterium]
MAETHRNSHNADQREAGRHQVLHTIRNAGSIARIDIARQAQVSPATVTTITSELLDAGLIEEIVPDNGHAEVNQSAKRGRPRVALRIRGDAHLIAGMKITDKLVTVILLDFDGNTVADHSEPLASAVLSSEHLVAAIKRAIGNATVAIGRQISDISGLGIGLSGLVDATRNFVHWSPSLTTRNVELGALLHAALPFACFVDNDANLVAKAEHQFGNGRGQSDFIVITIEKGVGMGIILNNQIYRGARGCGAEFGHTKVQLGGALCRCGQRGCLEAYVGDYALLREANIRSSAQPENDLAALYADAQAGDAMAKSIFDRASNMFAMGLANVINIFDPKLVILSGEQMAFDFLYSPTVFENVRSSVVQVDTILPEIQVHKWGDLMWAKGAAAYAIEQVSNATIQRLAANVA